MENEEEKVTCQIFFQEALEKIAHLEEKVAEQDRALKVCQEENTELKRYFMQVTKNLWVKILPPLFFTLNHLLLEMTPCKI